MEPTTNTLTAYYNVLTFNSSKLPPIIQKKGGSANKAGDAFEVFVKDMYCVEAQKYPYLDDKINNYKNYLSWQGDSSHFPDLIIRGGEGVEPKKMTSANSNLSLNSSYPKDYIYPDTQNLGDIEETNWTKKPLVYVIGTVPIKFNNRRNEESKCSVIWFAFGNTLAADQKVYKDLMESIRNNLSNVHLPRTTSEFSTTKELGRIKDVDGSGNTNLRLRGMWELANPNTAFKEYLDDNFVPSDATAVNLIMLSKDYDECPKKPDFSDLIASNQLIIKEIEIPDPNNENMKLKAKLFQGFTD